MEEYMNPDPFVYGCGIDFYKDGKGRTIVTYDGLDSGCEPSGYIEGVPVYTVFNRRGKESEQTITTDSNPLLSALKRERGFGFGNIKARKSVENRIKDVFLNIYRTYGPEITVLDICHSAGGAWLKKRFKDWVPSVNIPDCSCGFVINVGEVEYALADIVHRTLFNWYGTEMGYVQAAHTIFEATKKMRKTNDGNFSFRYIKDPTLRKLIELMMDNFKDDNRNRPWMKMSKYINNKHVIILSECTDNVEEVKICTNQLINCYLPNSVSIFTLFF